MHNAQAESQPNDNKRLAFLQNLIGKQLIGGFSPVATWLNGKLLEISATQITVEYTVREDMCNPMLILHGGVSATMLDDVVGTLVYALGREFGYASVNLNCDYLHPAQPGDILQVSANVVRAGKTIVHVEGRIVGPNDLIIAKCTSNLAQTSFRIPD
jgi:acyl-coenzyme A thioesterase 13